MTVEELIHHINTEVITSLETPPTLEVDAETYGNACHFIFHRTECISAGIDYKWGAFYQIALGHNRGLMFRGIELILKEKE